MIRRSPQFQSTVPLWMKVNVGCVILDERLIVVGLRDYLSVGYEDHRWITSVFVGGRATGG